MKQIITTPNQVGEILRSRRKLRRLSQQEVAAKLGLGQARLSMLEADSAGLTLDRLIALANLLGLELVIQDKSEVRVPPSEW